MANPDTQIGDTRIYSSKSEATSPSLTQCPLCKINAVPRGIASTRKVYGSTKEAGTGKASCPNCGHVYNLNKTNPAE